MAPEPRRIAGDARYPGERAVATMQHQEKEKKPTSIQEHHWRIIVLEAVMMAALAGAIVFVLFVLVRFFQLLFIPLDK